ncbi:MAG: hypothetical protein ACK481_08195 [Candidatus Melainabacteria bacterium]|jgi:hypothetical protein
MNDYIFQLNLVSAYGLQQMDSSRLKSEMNLENVTLYDFGVFKNKAIDKLKKLYERSCDRKLSLKDADGFYFKNNCLYFIEASQEHTEEEFTTKFLHSIFLLCFFTGLTQFNLKDMSINYYYYHPTKKDKYSGLIKDKDIGEIRRIIVDVTGIEGRKIEIKPANCDDIQNKLEKLNSKN